MQQSISRIVIVLILLGVFIAPGRPVIAISNQVDPLEFIVNSTQDAVDETTGDGVCAAANGACTLRAAIQEGYYFPASTIRFNITTPSAGPHIIYLSGSILPHVYNNILGPNLDGDEIVIDGTNGGTPLGRGLYVYNDATFVKGLTVQNFSRTAIDVAGDNAQIGGATSQEANVLCNSVYGIEDSIDTLGTVIYGNYIGVRKNGTTCPNTYGISINGTNTTIGGAVVGQRNIIGGNQYGIRVSYSAVNTSIKGNFIGLAATGTSVVPNTDSRNSDSW